MVTFLQQVVVLLMSTSLYAYTETTSQFENLAKPAPQICGSESMPKQIKLNELTDASDPNDVNVWRGQERNSEEEQRTQEKKFDVFAKALYWYTSETIDWGHILTSGTDFVQDDYQTISFDWNPGFRVGIGYNMSYDHWDTQVSYTWFQTRATDQVTGPITSGFLAARLSLFEPFQTGKMSLNLHYNMFDWDLGRNCQIIDSLFLRPFIGVKGGWIDQSIHMEWTTPNFIVPGFLYFASEKVKNDFLGGGPQGGVNGKWILGDDHKHVFSLIGHFASAFMWGHWSLQDRFVDRFSTHTSVPMGDRNFGALMLQAMAGFEWKYYFEEKGSHFAIELGYEIQDWVSHFQIFTNDSGTDNLDLILQGLTLDIALNF